MLKDMHDISPFACCIDQALGKIEEVRDIRHLYDTTKHCNGFFHSGGNASDFISAVISFYLDHADNATMVCDADMCSQPTTSWNMVYVCFWIFLFIFGFVANGIVCLSFVRFPLLQNNPSNYMVTSLAISDLLVVLVIIPFKVNRAVNNEKFCASLFLCRTLYTSDFVLFTASITNILCITVDRCAALFSYNHWRLISSPIRAKSIICVLWIYSAVWGFMVHFNPQTLSLDAIEVKNGECVGKESPIYLVSYIMVFYIPSTIMFLIYVKLTIISCKLTTVRSQTFAPDDFLLNHQPSTAPAIPAPDAGVGCIVSRRIEFRTMKLVLIVYGVFLLCWFPIIFINTFQLGLDSLEIKSSFVYSVVAEVLPISNSVVNPFIYAFLHRDFKRSIKKMANSLMQ